MNLHFFPCSSISWSTAFSTAWFAHNFSKFREFKPSLFPRMTNWDGFGTINATVYCFVASPYTQIFSTIGHVFSSVSTFPSETYSPSCNFTRSFLRSDNKKRIQFPIKRNPFLIYSMISSITHMVNCTGKLQKLAHYNKHVLIPCCLTLVWKVSNYWTRLLQWCFQWFSSLFPNAVTAFWNQLSSVQILNYTDIFHVICNTENSWDVTHITNTWQEEGCKIKMS